MKENLFKIFWRFVIIIGFLLNLIIMILCFGLFPFIIVIVWFIDGERGVEWYMDKDIVLMDLPIVNYIIKLGEDICNNMNNKNNKNNKILLADYLTNIYNKINFNSDFWK